MDILQIILWGGGIGTIILIFMGLIKFIAGIYKDRADMIDIKKSQRNFNSRLIGLEKKNYELSFDFGKLNKRINNFFETKVRRKNG